MNFFNATLNGRDIADIAGISIISVLSVTTCSLAIALTVTCILLCKKNSSPSFNHVSINNADGSAYISVNSDTELLLTDKKNTKDDGNKRKRYFSSDGSLQAHFEQRKYTEFEEHGELNLDALIDNGSKSKCNIL
jgi:hypothetical protein